MIPRKRDFRAVISLDIPAPQTPQGRCRDFSLEYLRM
jgi:hypothetical protein